MGCIRKNMANILFMITVLDGAKVKVFEELHKVENETRRLVWNDLSPNGDIRVACSATISNDKNTDQRPKASSTIDQEDVDRFSALSGQWWRENGEFQALHTLNELRVPLIRDALLQTCRRDGAVTDPLKGFTVLDVGSGGGILAEPLARLGASVIGIDASEENIYIAQSHALLDPKVTCNLKYIHSSVEDLVRTEEGKFDAVIASEIVEHVFNAPEFVSSCSKLVKPGGSMFITTINKTYLSYILGVAVAEYILQLVPQGTHDWEKFINPQEMQDILKHNMMSPRLVHGMCFNPLTHRWSWINDISINYVIHAVKPDSTE